MYILLNHGNSTYCGEESTEGNYAISLIILFNQIRGFKMSVLEWFFVGAIILFFVGVAFFAMGDLFRDRKFYKDKQKNVKKISDKKVKKRGNL